MKGAHTRVYSYAIYDCDIIYNTHNIIQSSRILLCFKTLIHRRRQSTYTHSHTHVYNAGRRKKIYNWLDYHAYARYLDTYHTWILCLNISVLCTRSHILYNNKHHNRHYNPN